MQAPNGQRFEVFVTEPKEHPAFDDLREIANVRLGRTGGGYSEDELAELVATSHAVMITSRDTVTRKVIEAAPNLRIVSKFGARPENIDLAAAAERQVKVLCTPWSNTESVAEHTVLLTLAILRRLPLLADHVRHGGWRNDIPLGVELSGKTIGLVGLGNVAGKVAEKLAGFGVRLLAHDPYATPEKAAGLGVVLTDLESLLAEADVVSLHAMVTPETRHMIGSEQFKLMRPGAVLVNTARGSLVDEAALLVALDSGLIAGAAIDVYEVEPPSVSNPLLAMENVIATPHAAAYTHEAMGREIPWAVEDVKRVLLGEDPLHC